MGFTIGTFSAGTPVPVNVMRPSVTGTAQVAQVLTCNPGSWVNQGPFTYQWLRDGVVISSATNATYTAVAGDVAKKLSCRVTSSTTLAQWTPGNSAVSNETAAVIA